MFDEQLFYFINGVAGKYFWLDVLGIFLAKYLPYFLIVSLVFFLIINRRKYWKMIVGSGIAAILGRFIIVEIIRMLHNRTRPFLSERTHQLLTHSSTSAFPSGHATVFFAISTIIYIYNKKAGIAFFILSFLMCLGRIYTGLHWPLDILGGMSVGVLSGYLIHYVLERIAKK